MKPYHLILFLFLGCASKNNECLCLEVNDSFSISQKRPISIPLDDMNKPCWEKEMVLIKKSEKGTQIIPYQLNVGEKSTISFQHSSNEGTKTTYCFTNQKDPTASIPFQHQKEDGNLKITHGDQSLIQYRYEMTLPPEGVNPLYKKSGYIHPVLSPKGDTLTRIQPPDHYHHYGIWGPWTRTRVDNIGVDFWNLKDGQGTVLFKDFNTIESGAVYGGFSAHQEHIYFTPKQDPQIALNENLKVKVWKNNNPNQYFIDYTSQFSSPLEKGMLFEAYRYGGGLGFRFKEQWDKDNCEVLTSEGKDRVAADGTSARWCIVKGVSSDGKGSVGVLFMSHPNNQSHPEPMRVWPLNANKDRGDMFFEFCPIRHEEWKIEPQKSYELNYRMLVFEGTITPKEAEEHWKAFAFQPEINFIKN
jgi:hypothetical protein